MSANPEEMEKNLETTSAATESEKQFRVATSGGKTGLKRILEEDGRKTEEEKRTKRPKLTKVCSYNGTFFYIGEKVLAVYQADGLFYEASICGILNDGKKVQVDWFNHNPLHREVNVEDIQRLDTSQFYVGEKIWAKYYPDREMYTATILKVDEANEILILKWFNDNPEHRRVKISDCKKMSDLDREEAEKTEAETQNEVKDLKFDLRKEVSDLVPEDHYIRKSPRKKNIVSQSNPFF